MLDKHYQPHQLERSWYQRWTSEDIFKKLSQREDAPAYCIMIPPPNVTGTLHMGHAFQDTLMDTLIRAHAQQGYKVLWQVGTDHAGIATQMVVERLLERQGLNRKEMGREAFLEKVWEWKSVSGGQILGQLKRLGTFIDWERERFTMDEQYNDAVREAFIKLYRDQLIYRKKRLVNWDCHLQSAVSDLEVEFHEEQGFLYHIAYPLENHHEQLVVATTRPETLFGDVAVAVHPEDERYQHLIGQQLKLPLTGRLIPIIADSHIDREFGTGCVKITPAHDFNDFAMAERHHLPLINILHLNGQLNDRVPEDYQGLDRIKARPLIVQALVNLGLLLEKKPHTHQVPRCSRTDQVIEPLSTDQWYVAMEGMAKAALQAHTQGDLNFIPESWQKHYQHWLNNIQDWCISRQLWWGHQIPAWYDQDGNVYVGDSEEDVRTHYAIPTFLTLKQDPDVLDTWFSSALWPFVTLGWPKKQAEMKDFFPTNVLVTGFDIIFFWVARMIMFSLYFTGKVPFKDIYIHGLIQDHQGQKMSKSKGNVIDPIDLIDGISLKDLLNKRTHGLMQPEKAAAIAAVTQHDFPEGLMSYGADALRLTFCQQASPGRFIRFDTQRMQSSHNFCNKLWNMMRFTLMHLEDIQPFDGPHTHPIHHWITHHLQSMQHQAKHYLAEYRFDLLAQHLVDFTWTVVCDQYLECAKVLLKDTNTRPEAQMVLKSTIHTVLQLLHPMMPFITEELASVLHQQLYPEQPYTLLVLQQQNLIPESAYDRSSVESLLELITILRTVRSKLDVAPKAMIELSVNPQGHVIKLCEAFAPFIQDLCKVKDVHTMQPLEGRIVRASFNEESFSLILPVVVVDIAVQRERLLLDQQKCQKEIEKAQQKLLNEAFVSKAPPAVVEQEKQRLAELSVQLETIIESLHQMI